MLSDRIEEWMKEWKEAGMEEGRKEGRKEGEIILLQQQLTKRFGLLPKWVSEQLNNADQNELELWADRILDAKTLEEVFHG